MRTRNVVRQVNNNGVESGVSLTQRDISLITHTVRWWITTPDTLIRLMYPQEAWENWFIRQEDYQGLRKARLSVSRRMRSLRQITADDRPIEAAALDRSTIVYWATAAAGELISAPWESYPPVAVTRASHAFAASDVGGAIERHFPLAVCSTREWEAGERLFSKHDIASGREASNSRETNMHPDLAVLNTDNDRVIACDIERKRSVHEWRGKLESYQANSDVTAVWLFISHRSTAARLRALAAQLHSSNRPVPIRILKLVPHNSGYHDAQAALQSASVREDIDQLHG